MTDRRFGTINKFGTSNTFGASSDYTPAYLLWGVEVDWDGDGIFSGYNEAKYMIGYKSYRGRQSFINRDGKGYQRLLTGRLTIKLDNTTGRYDAWNTSSPLYPNVTYGKDIKITVRSVSSGTIYPVFYGVIENIEPVNNSDGEKYVTITAVDGWQYLRNYTARYAVQNNIAPETAIGYVLDNISWHWGRNLDSTADTIRYWWANGNKQAATIVEDVSESFLGYVYVGRDGIFNFKQRTNVTAAVADLSSDEILKDLTLPQPWEYSRNVTRVKVHPRIAASTGVIYVLVGTPPSIQNGETLELFGDYTYNNIPVPANSVVTPVATTDYTMNTQADGGGTDETASCSVSITDFGDSVKFQITNNSGVTVYLTLLQLRGDALYEPNVSDVVYQTADYSSMPREFKLDLLWQQDINVATDFSNLLGPFLSELHPFPVIQIEERPDLQFLPELFDIVSLTLPTLGINGDTYRVGYIEHESLLNNCQSMRTKFYLESYLTLGDYWTWDTASVFDTSTIFGA